MYNVASDNYNHLTITEWDWAWYEELYKTRRVLSNEVLKPLVSNSLLEATSKSWHFWWSLTVGSTVCPLKTNWPRNRKNGERTGPDLFPNFKPCETGYESVYYGIITRNAQSKKDELRFTESSSLALIRAILSKRHTAIQKTLQFTKKSRIDVKTMCPAIHTSLLKLSSI